MAKSIIIIGGGIAGLAAGCYGQMNGYQTKIFEMHTLPGGVCTSWKRNGYTIDGCIHWLVGSNPNSRMNRLWSDLGVTDLEYINHEEFTRVEDSSGKTFIVYTDLDKLRVHMKELSPQDERVIDEFIKACHTCSRVDLPPGESKGLWDGLRSLRAMAPLGPLLTRYKKVTVADFARRFSDPFLASAFMQAFGGDLIGFPITAMMMTLGWLAGQNAGYAIGGSLNFARAIERKYRELGGEIAYNSQVVKIIVEEGRAVGVCLADGTEHRADWVISAADGHKTIFKLLDGKYVDAKIQGYYHNLKLFPPIVYVGIGVNRTFPEFPHSVSGLKFPLQNSLTLGGRELKKLEVSIYNFDPTLAPEGKTVLKTMFEGDYDWWERLAADREAYIAEKEGIAVSVVDALNHRFPGLKEQVEMIDVATPVTWERYTGNWRGAYEGWLISTETMGMKLPKTLPGLGRFYMAGQWVEPGGGLPTAAMSGRDVIKMIAKKDRRR